MKHIVKQATKWGDHEEYHALSQGWSLFTVDSADVVIQKVDDPPAHHLWDESIPEDEQFDSDAAAIRFVRKKAREGDAVAQKALAVHDANIRHWTRFRALMRAKGVL